MPEIDNAGDAPYKSREWLSEKYHDGGLSQHDIAELCDVNQANISYWMDKLSIETRGYQKAVAMSRSGKFANEEWLREEYRNKTISEISNEHGYSTSTLKKYLNKYDIETRGAHRRIGKFRGEDNPQWEGGDQSWRKGIKWQEAREAARRRDNHRCQRCEEESATPHVHHITPVSNGGEKYSMKNLITLCPDCHYAQHS